MTGHWFFNADFRIFGFVERKKPGGEFALTQQDVTRRGGLGWSWEERVAVGEGLPEEDNEEETGHTLSN